MTRSLWGMETSLELVVKKGLCEKKPFQFKLESYNKLTLGQGGQRIQATEIKPYGSNLAVGQFGYGEGGGGEPYKMRLQKQG